MRLLYYYLYLFAVHLIPKAMALYYGRHSVRDYKEWRPYFDGDQPRLSSIGVKLLSVMQSSDDPNEIHFIFDIPDFHIFIQLLQSPESRVLLQKSGVLGQPVMYRLQATLPEEVISYAGK